MRNEMQEDIYKLTKMLIETNTENPPGNEEVLVNRILKWLEPWEPQYKKIYIEKNRCCLLLWLEGEKKEYLGFAGHLDTVPVGEKQEWEHSPFEAERIGNVVYGRGAADMKGGLAAMLFLYTYYKKKEEKPPYGILFIFTADEEVQGKGMLELCQRHELDGVKALFVCEPTGNTIGLGELGTLWLRFLVKGKSCHASMSDLGINALEVGIKIVEEFQRKWGEKCSEDSLLGKESCCLTQVSGGVKINIIPERAEFCMDIRTVPKKDKKHWEHEEIVMLAKEICAKWMTQKQGLSASVEVLTNRSAVGMEKDSIFIQKLLQSAQRAGKPVKCTPVRFFTDASIALQALPIPFVIFGPGNPQECHKTDEKIDILQIKEAVEYYQIFIEELGKTKERSQWITE